MKLLLDEMYSPAIAHELRRRGHDVQAITERSELRSLPDDQVYSAAQEEGRAVVTENVADFIRAARTWDEHARAHHGLVLVDPATYPRGSAATLGRIVIALDALLAGHPDSVASGARHWL